MHLSAAGLQISEMQFYQHFTNSLPPELDMVVVIHDPIPSNYSVDILCEHFCAIELCKDLHTAKGSSTTMEEPTALLAKQKGFRGTGRSTVARGEKSELSAGKPRKI